MAAGGKGQATREAILAAAAAQFRVHGYGASTLEDIATELGMTRAAVLYHFSSKEELLHAVVGPYLDALAAAVERHRVDERPSLAGRNLIVGFLDAAVAHDLAAGILFRDVTSWEQGTVRQRVDACSSGFRDAMTGPEPTAEMRTLATCLLGALLRPLIDPKLDQTDPVVRAAILEVAFSISRRIDRLRTARSAPADRPLEPPPHAVLALVGNGSAPRI